MKWRYIKTHCIVYKWHALYKTLIFSYDILPTFSLISDDYTSLVTSTLLTLQVSRLSPDWWKWIFKSNLADNRSVQVSW